MVDQTLYSGILIGLLSESEPPQSLQTGVELACSCWLLEHEGGGSNFVFRNFDWVRLNFTIEMEEKWRRRWQN